MNSLIVTLEYIRSFDQHRPLTLSADLEIFSEFFKIVSSSWIVDRTEETKLPFRTNVLNDHKLNYVSQNTLSLDDACQHAVEKYKNITTPIYVLWSGGIDSTLILVSFLKYGFDKSKIIVACNFDGIKENYNFYKNFILPNFKVIASEMLIQQLDSGTLINGDPADALLGIDLSLGIFKKYGSEYLLKPCSREVITEYFINSGLSHQAANCWYDYYISSINFSPRQIVTVQDFSWWITFNHRWQTANEKLKTRIKSSVNYCRFFDSEHFQNWAINKSNTTITRLQDFKYDYQKIIFDYTKDQEYFYKKIKLSSASFTFGSQPYAAILDNGLKLKSDEFNIFDYYDRNNFIDDWLSIN
jgi:hypothetical protein